MLFWLILFVIIESTINQSSADSSSFFRDMKNQCVGQFSVSYVISYSKFCLNFDFLLKVLHFMKKLILLFFRYMKLLSLLGIFSVLVIKVSHMNFDCTRKEMLPIFHMHPRGQLIWRHIYNDNIIIHINTLCMLRTSYHTV